MIKINHHQETVFDQKYTKELIDNINSKIVELSQKLNMVSKTLLNNPETTNDDLKYLLQKISYNLNKLEDLSHIVYVSHDLIDSITQDSSPINNIYKMN